MLVLVVSVFLVIAPIIDSPKMEFIYSIVFMLCGAAIYVPFVHYRMKLPYMGERSRGRGFKSGSWSGTPTWCTE